MSQKIFNQARNEWRSNLWLCVELFIVSVALWYVVDFLYVKATLAMRPLGFDIENCYVVETTTLPEYATDFIEGKSPDDIVADKSTLLERLKRLPEVESACLSISSYPYNLNSSWNNMRVDTAHTGSLVRQASPGFATVFRIHGASGEKPAELDARLALGKALVSDNLFSGEHPYNDPGRTKGARLFPYGDTIRSIEIGGVYKTMLYTKYTQARNNRSIILPLGSESMANADEYCVRIKPGTDADFVDRIAAAARNGLAAGNFRVTGVKPFSEVRETRLASPHAETRNYLIGMAFLMLNIFLGLLGTFWFRTQQRVPDIAMRIVCGARRPDIFRLLLSEGLLLLTIVTPLAIVVDINIAHLELNAWMDGFFSWKRILICAGATYALMALMIAAGISFPAARAMHTAPAEALRDE